MSQPYLHFNGTTLNDQTTTLSDYFNGSTSLTIGSDKYLYISTALPFRQLYIALGTDAVTSETLAVEYYAGKQHGWVSSTYLRDETNGLSTSGYITIQPDRSKPWVRTDTADVTELSSFTLYQNYWVRLSLSADFAVDLKWLGHKFCNSAQVYRQYPAVNNDRVRSAFESGKTDWEDQTIIASELIIEDLQKDYAFEDAAQIADQTDLKSSCIHRVVALIYAGLGDVGVDNVERAMAEYRQTLRAGALVIDADGDGLISPSEKKPRQSILVR